MTSRKYPQYRIAASNLVDCPQLHTVRLDGRGGMDYPVAFMSKTETHHFQAEIQQLLNIVIHSLYTCLLYTSDAADE